MDLSELGEAAAFLRRSRAELLPLQAVPFDGKPCGGCWFPGLSCFWVAAESFDWRSGVVRRGT